MIDSDILITITKKEYDELNDFKKELENLKKERNENTYKFINNPDNKEKIKEKRREYARKNYEILKNDEGFMKKKREEALKNYYKKKNAAASLQTV